MPFIKRSAQTRGLSLLELMAVVTILGILAAMGLSTASVAMQEGQRTACHVNREEIEIQCQLWHRAQGSYPSSTLVTIKTDKNYFPEGLPLCPVDGSSYTIDATTGLVVGHDH